jgi:hypothetical protein
VVGCEKESPKQVPQEETKNDGAVPLGEDFTIPNLDLEMIWVKPGSFTMSSPSSEDGRFLLR